MNKKSIYLWFYRDQEFQCSPDELKVDLQKGETLAWPQSELPKKEGSADSSSFQLGAAKVSLDKIKVIFIHHQIDLAAWEEDLKRANIEIIEATGNDWTSTFQNIQAAQSVEDVRDALEAYQEIYRKKRLDFLLGLISHRAFTGLATVRMIVDAINERVQERDWGGVKDLLGDLKRDWRANPEHRPTYYLAEMQGMLVGAVKGALVEPTSSESGGSQSRWPQENSLEAAISRECPSKQHNDKTLCFCKTLEDPLTKLAEHAGLKEGCDSQWQASRESRVAIYLYGLELLASEALTDSLRWLRELPKSADSDVVWLFAKQQTGERKSESHANEPHTVGGTEDFDYGAWLKDLDRLFSEFQSAVASAQENSTKAKG